jgi:hypothetical protein
VKGVAVKGAIRPVFLVIVLVCLATFVVVPAVILAYPLPDVRGGWCQSGGRPGHYRVEEVAKALMFLNGAAAAALLVAVAIFTRSVGWTLAALTLSVIALYFGYFIYAGAIDCAFY